MFFVFYKKVFHHHASNIFYSSVSIFLYTRKSSVFDINTAQNSPNVLSVILTFCINKTATAVLPVAGEGNNTQYLV